MAESAAPVAPEEAARLFAPLEMHSHLLVAVSGGPDSMALLHLLADWRDRLGEAAPALAAATIDHQLRAGSAAEAEFVARTARALNIPHTIARWGGRKPANGIPAAARAARYRLLREIAEEAAPGQFSTVVTAHTLDDQAETFLMRLQRGAGVEGLAEMERLRAIAPDEDCFVTLARPLLDVPKARLAATLRARGLTWIEDPSNACLDQERPRTRVLLAQLESYGLSAAAIARSAKRLRSAQDALKFAETCFLEDVAVRVDHEIYAELDADAFQSGPKLLRQRLLSGLIARFGGATPLPRLSEVEDLVESLHPGGEVRATLGGAVVSLGARALRVWREAGRVTGKPLLLQDGAPKLWDNRFWVSADVTGRALAVYVRPLGADGLAGLPPGARPEAPSRALWALPGFFIDGQLISVPALTYHVHPDVQCTAEPSWRGEP